MTGRTRSPLAAYARFWKRVPRELGFLVLTLPIGLAGFITTITLFTSGIGTIVTFFIGVVVIIACLYVARGFGTLELLRLEWAGQPPLDRPVWAAGKPGFWGWLRNVFSNGHYWLYLLHTMIINFVISLFTWIVTITWVSVAFSGVTYWFWSWSVPSYEVNFHVSSWILERFGIDAAQSAIEAVDLVFYTILGIVFLAVLPFVTRGLVLLHHVFAKITLAAFASDALRLQVATLTESRGAAQSAEGHSLRRLERDIHDGPQQRLVRMQMDLAAADRKLDSDPTAARELIAEATQQARDALEELRSLSRGFAPPMLLDRGLVAALESLGDRSTIPVRVVSELDGVALPTEIERNAYFVASEAVANAGKHAAASDIEIRVWTRRVADGDATWLDLTVTDNGSGGAVPVAGHGLAGLEERLRGIGGFFEVRSPVGGPTTLIANFPVTVAG
jgi:signal transduction histidine kinase